MPTSQPQKPSRPTLLMSLPNMACGNADGRWEMTKPVVAVIAPGSMGSAVGKRLSDHGAHVITSLEGRSEASRERARHAAMAPVIDAQIADADLILSIVPPAEALPLAKRLAFALKRGER